MVKKLAFVLYNWSIDAALLVCLYLWQFHGIPWAENIFMFFTWALSVIFLLIGFSGDKVQFAEYDSDTPSWWPKWRKVRHLIMTVSMVAAGLIVLPIVYLLAIMACSAARNREPKPKMPPPLYALPTKHLSRWAEFADVGAVPIGIAFRMPDGTTGVFTDAGVVSWGRTAEPILTKERPPNAH
jgi:hypothetical protein